MKSSARPSLLILIPCLWTLASQLSHAILDTNNNGLSDVWEKLFYNNQLVPSTYNPQADPDGDGWTNIQEATAGTNPNSAVPPTGFIQPTITHVPATDENGPGGTPVIATREAMTISWPTQSGKLYTLKFSPDFTPNSWIEIDTPDRKSVV